MKYRLLTKEQLEALHEEFAVFLASQQIDAKEWQTIKKDKPKIAIQELEIFSDLVWDRVLQKANYLEHFSKDSINVFKCEATTIHRIVVQINNSEIDLLSEDGYAWFIDNSTDASIEYFKGEKPYTQERSLEIFDLIEKGSVIADGKLYDTLSQLIAK